MDTTIETHTAGGVWTCASVTEQPDLVLTEWAVFEIQLPGTQEITRHFVGHNIAFREGRISSAIGQFDPTNWRGVSKDGRVYGLRGRPGLTADGELAWRRWISINEATEVVDVTNALLALMAHN